MARQSPQKPPTAKPQTPPTGGAVYAPPPASLRVLIAGISGSGKSTSAELLYLKHFPRRIVIDPLGEWASKCDAYVYSPQDFVTKLQVLAPSGRWSIAVCMGVNDDFATLVDYLVPLDGDMDTSPIRLVGGAVLMVDEVDLVAEPRSVKKDVRTAWRRSRHAGLSIVATTQRPEAVSREVSSQSQHILCLHLVEPRAFDYMEGYLRIDRASLDRWTNKYPHGGVWRDTRSGALKWWTGRAWAKGPASVASRPASIPLDAESESPALDAGGERVSSSPSGSEPAPE